MLNDDKLGIQDDGMCRCCGKRPAAGYVIGSGCYLPHLCLRCWKNGGSAAEAISGMAGRQPNGYRCNPKPMAHLA